VTGSRWQAAGCRAQVVGRRSQVAGRRQVCSARVRLVRLTAALTLTLTRRAAGAADGSGYPPLHEEDLCLVKWKGLGYEAATWEAGTLLLTLADAAARVAEYEVWSDRPLQLDTSRHRPRPQGTETPYEKYDEQPTRIVGGVDALPLHKYQLEGLNWLRSCWHRGLNVMLADEMGLGKTVQTVGLVAALHAEYTRGPFLVCVPLSTVPNWDREFRRWAPQLNCVTYCGSKEARQLCRDLDFHFGQDIDNLGAKNGTAPLKLHVLISSYEIVLADQLVLRKVGWEALIIDEGHRLKCKTSKLFEALQTLRTSFRLLLTGTPLQNNLEELWTLLHFLQPEEFASLETFQSSFETLDHEDQIGKLAEYPEPAPSPEPSPSPEPAPAPEPSPEPSPSPSPQPSPSPSPSPAPSPSPSPGKLHGMLAPHILRRVKADVLRDLIPKKKELMVRVELSEKQRVLYQVPH
jgi:SNF2 family DNA or RNA helicase